MYNSVLVYFRIQTNKQIDNQDSTLFLHENIYNMYNIIIVNNKKK